MWQIDFLKYVHVNFLVLTLILYEVKTGSMLQKKQQQCNNYVCLIHQLFTKTIQQLSLFNTSTIYQNSATISVQYLNYLPKQYNYLCSILQSSTITISITNTLFNTLKINYNSVSFSIHYLRTTKCWYYNHTVSLQFTVLSFDPLTRQYIKEVPGFIM